MVGISPNVTSGGGPSENNRPIAGGSSLTRDAFSAEFTLTAREYYCAANLFWPKLSFWKFSPVVLIPIGFVCASQAFGALRNQEFSEAALFTGIGAFGAPLASWLIYQCAGWIKRWLILRKFKKELSMRVVFDEAGIKSSDADGIEVSVPWKDVFAIYDDGLRLLFLFNKRSFVLTPKHCFEGSDLHALIRALYRWGAPRPTTPPEEDWLFEGFRRGGRNSH